MRWSEACELKRFRYPLSRRHPRLVGLYAAGAWMLGATGLHRSVPSADYLYRAGLALSWCGRHRMALRLLGAAARRYRNEGSVVELARLRVNEIIVCYRQAEAVELQRALNEEIVLRLSRLETLESPEPPFACLAAGGLLNAWMSRQSFVLGGAEERSSMLSPSERQGPWPLEHRSDPLSTPQGPAEPVTHPAVQPALQPADRAA